MERSEPPLIPEWLRGASGGVLATSQPGFYQDDGGNPYFPRPRATQQVAGGHVEYDSPRGLASSDRVFFSSARRSHSSNPFERVVVDRENYIQGRLHPSLTRSSSSIRSYDTSDRERDGYRLDGAQDREWERDSDRDFRPREKDMLSGFGSDERERDRDRMENGKVRLSVPEMPGRYDTDAKLRLSLRISDSNVWKMNEAASVSSPVPSVSGALATSMQKAVFDRNFPSLGTDDKPGGLLLSPGSTSVASQHSLWQSSARSDLGRASSPGLGGGFGGPIPTTPSSMNGGSGGGDVWSSALAEAPTSNGNLQNNTISSSGWASSVSSVPSAAATVTVLNMAEALAQNPPRVRTPPQLSVESQRLEELALKQSRQLIPMMPSLPKTMTLADKAKSKAIRSVDGTVTASKLNQLSGSLQLNSVHRLTNPTRPDTPKHSQGKLLVLKASKDGGIVATTTLNCDGSNSTQALYHGNIGITASMSAASLSVSATGVIGQRKKSNNDRGAPSQLGAAGPDAFTGLRAKDIMEDKRPSIQAQNRIDFFNALRKKAAGNGSALNTLESVSPQIKSDVISNKSAMPQEAGAPSHGSEAIENGVGEDSLSVECLSQIHNNRDIEHTPGNGLITDEIGSPVKDSLAVEQPEESLCMDSEEEEAAFMRSLGWEENAEGSELTEDEINSFYQMRERKKLLNSKGRYTVCVEHSMGSLGNSSSGMSLTDSDSDDEPHT